ncbi:hypothetical protein KO02_16955 [Sphingobacterium sp. ML3W]|nr:hypothetical protein KO02_16955 [Sphingobacterium sp. ML3W]
MLWMNTSKRIAWRDKSKLWDYLANRKKHSRVIAIALFLLAIVCSIYTIGVASGIFAFVVILMCMACLIVFFFPFAYFGYRAVLGVYLCSFLIEVFIH